MMELNQVEDYWHLLEAARAGKTIQLLTGLSLGWVDVKAAAFCEKPGCYRVKPEVVVERYQLVSDGGGYNRIVSGIGKISDTLTRLAYIDVSIDSETKKVSVKVIDHDAE